jgi:hypothetical protein
MLLGGAVTWPRSRASACRTGRADFPHPALGQDFTPVLSRARIGVLMSAAADDLEGQARITTLLQRLQEFGWTAGRNLRIDTRWGAGDVNLYRRYAAELVALAPDLIVATTSPVFATLQQATHRSCSWSDQLSRRRLRRQLRGQRLASYQGNE